MSRLLTICLLAGLVSPAMAEEPELIVQWKKDPIHLFVGPKHETMMLRPKSELPPEAVVVTRQEPLLGFKDTRTNEMAFVNKSEVATNRVAGADASSAEPRRGRCTRALGTGFASSC